MQTSPLAIPPLETPPPFNYIYHYHLIPSLFPNIRVFPLSPNSLTIPSRFPHMVFSTSGKGGGGGSQPNFRLGTLGTLGTNVSKRGFHIRFRVFFLTKTSFKSVPSLKTTWHTWHSLFIVRKLMHKFMRE